MSYNRLIHDYLEGELDQTGEDALFAHLSANSGLRNEFNTQVKLNNLVAMDLNRITVPSDLTGAVFSRLGYANAPSVVALQDDSVGFVKKYSGFLILLLLLFTAGTSIYLYMENSNLKGLLGTSSNSTSYPTMESYASDENINSNLRDNQSEFSNNLSDVIPSSNSTKNSIANSTSSRKSGTQKGNFGNNLFVSDNKNISQKDNYLDLKTDSREFTNSIKFFGSFDNSISPNAYFSENDYRVNSAISTKSLDYGNEAYIYNPNGLYSLNLPNWSIQLRYLNNQGAYPPYSVNSDESIFMNNSIGVWYHYTRDISFGVELGNEKFAQEFIYNNLNYSQSPSMYWGGISFRYNMPDIIPYTLNPYIVTTAAYSSIGGGIGKAQGGIIFNISEPFSVFVGAEYGVLIYSVSSRLYDSQKLGLTGGININFR